jgi:ferredoxin
MRVIVNDDRCSSSGECVLVAPEVFELGDDDLLYVLQETPPEALRDKVESAVRVCPKQAIAVEA